MVVDFQKLQDDVNSIKNLLLTLNAQLKNEQPSNSSESELLTVSQAAELLNLTSATVYGMVYEKRIPFCKPAGSGRLFFVRSELLEWVKNGRKTTSDKLDDQARELVSNRLDRRKQSKHRVGGRKAA